MTFLLYPNRRSRIADASVCNPVSSPLQVDARNVDGSTPLCDACSSGSLECVRLLLQHGAKANAALTSRTASPLHEACIGGCFFSVSLQLASSLRVTGTSFVLFRKCRLCEAPDRSGCSSGGV